MAVKHGIKFVGEDFYTNMNNRKALEQLSNKEIALYWDKLQERLGELEMLGAQDDCGVSEDYEVLEEVKSCVSTKKLCISILRERWRISFTG